jgi:hypothetical protein
MSRLISDCLLLGVLATSVLNIGCAYAGPCSTEIARIEKAMSEPDSDVGPSNRQSIGAQLGRQPTPSSVARAEKRADSKYVAAMDQARALDAQGNSDCIQAIEEVKLLIGMQ